MRDWVGVPFTDQKAPEAPAAAPPPADRPTVFIALPTHDGYHKSEAVLSMLVASRKAVIHPEIGKASLLDTNFNRLLCIARNNRKHVPWTHWCMMHNDIAPEALWLDILLGEMARTGADVLSAVVAIKDERRLTSTGTVQADGSIRRLTLKECHRLPETFCAADLPAIGIHTSLVVNTGLLLLDFTKPWADEFAFSSGAGIVRGPEGDWQTIMIPEDWNFSHWANQKGLKVYATRKVHVDHWDGGARWDNAKHEDGWETDLGDNPAMYEEVLAARKAEVAA